MPVTIQSLGIDRLSLDEQLELVHAIWNHIAATNKVMPLSDEFREELDRRIAEDDANPDAAIPWEGVKARALERLQ